MTCVCCSLLVLFPRFHSMAFASRLFVGVLASAILIFSCARERGQLKETPDRSTIVMYRAANKSSVLGVRCSVLAALKRRTGRLQQSSSAANTEHRTKGGCNNLPLSFLLLPGRALRPNGLARTGTVVVAQAAHVSCTWLRSGDKCMTFVTCTRTGTSTEYKYELYHMNLYSEYETVPAVAPSHADYPYDALIFDITNATLCDTALLHGRCAFVRFCREPPQAGLSNF